MAIKLLDDIHAAEDAAEQLVHDAQHEAREMVKGTQEAVLANERDAAARLREEYQKILAEKRAAVEEDIRKNANDKQKAAEALAEKAREKLPDAAKAIFERVMSDGNR